MWTCSSLQCVHARAVILMCASHARVAMAGRDVSSAATGHRMYIYGPGHTGIQALYSMN